MAHSVSSTTAWRDSARIAKFFIIDARAAFPFLFLFVHIRLWTFILATVTTAAFAILDYYGFSVVVFMRALRTFIAGKRKLSRPWWRKDIPK
ncbi:MAG: IcmT/TraK family protein [Gammaproteobacteria bacterium]